MATHARMIVQKYSCIRGFIFISVGKKEFVNYVCC